MIRLIKTQLYTATQIIVNRKYNSYCKNYYRVSNYYSFVFVTENNAYFYRSIFVPVIPA